MKHLIQITAACLLVAMALGACNWGIVVGEQDGDTGENPDVIGDGEIDTLVEIDTRPDTDGVPPDTGEPDAGEPDAGEPDRSEPDIGEPDAAEPDQPDIVEDVGGEQVCGNHIQEGSEECDDGNSSDTDDCLNDCTNATCGDMHIWAGVEDCDDGNDDNTDACLSDCTDAGCGDGYVQAGVEECDDSSDFCAACALTAPSGWIECTDSSGNTVFLYLVHLTGNNTYAVYKDYCESFIGAMGPQNYDFYGLAVFSDQAVWDCVSPSLNTAINYYIGLEQDTSAPDYGEPGGGWYWVGYDGTNWNNLDSYSATNPYLPGTFDDGGGTTGDAECGRLAYGGGVWRFSDYGCTSTTNWDGICMIQY